MYRNGACETLPPVSPLKRERRLGRQSLPLRPVRPLHKRARPALRVHGSCPRLCSLDRSELHCAKPKGVLPRRSLAVHMASPTLASVMRAVVYGEGKHCMKMVDQQPVPTPSPTQARAALARARRIALSIAAAMQLASFSSSAAAAAAPPTAAPRTRWRTGSATSARTAAQLRREAGRQTKTDCGVNESCTVTRCSACGEQQRRHGARAVTGVRATRCRPKDAC